MQKQFNKKEFQTKLISDFKIINDAVNNVKA